ncbi:MAG: energy transducer TonB [Verrucomicrobia bacterium]|nr:energy transducer TonB [Verrucomicrobiota bacterium]
MPTLSSNLREFHSGRLSGALRIALGVSLALHLVAAVTVKMFWNGNGSGNRPTETSLSAEFSEEAAVVGGETGVAMRESLFAPVPIAEAAENPKLPDDDVVPASKIPESDSKVATTAVVDSNVVSVPSSSSPTVASASATRETERKYFESGSSGGAGGNGVGIVTVKGGPGVLARPVYRKNPEPAYPAAARRRRQQGVTLLAVAVSASGRAVRVVVKESSGYQMLDDAAVRAVVDWEFEPARSGAVAVASEIEVPVRFQLKQ